VREQPPQVKRSLPGIAFELELREMPVREEGGVTALLGYGHQPGQKSFRTLGRGLERFFRLRPKLVDRAWHSTHLHSYSRLDF
jgi:hypothetical protein